MSFTVDRLVGVADFFDRRQATISYAAIANNQSGDAAVGFSIGVLIGSALNIIIAYVFSVILVWLFKLDTAMVFLVLPPLYLLFDALISIPLILGLFRHNPLFGLIFAGLRIIGLYLLYWQAKLGVWLFGKTLGEEIPFGQSSFALFENWLPMFDSAMEKPGYAALITIGGTLLLNLIFKRPLQTAAA